MGTLLSGRLRAVSGLTDRDIVLGTLLALDREIEAADDGTGAGTGPRGGRQGENDEPPPAASLFETLLSEMLAAVGDEEEFAEVHGYGFPEWLVRGSRAPLLRLSCLLTSADTPLWTALGKRLDEKALGERLLNFAMLLEESSPPPPTPRFRALRDEAVLRPDGTIANELTASSGNRPGELVERIARSAIGCDDLLDRELGWRLLRFDFPIVTQGAGALIGAELAFGPPTGRRVHIPQQEQIVEIIDPKRAVLSTWTGPSDATFERSVLRASEMAEQLLARLREHTSPDATRTCTAGVFLRGLLPPRTVNGNSIELPLALEILRRTLDLPHTDWVASGDFEESGSLRPLPPDTIRAKWQAVRADGLKAGLLVAGAAIDGLQLDGLRLLLGKEQSLEGAARALWGERWDELVAGRRRHIAAEHCFSPGWRGGSWPNAVYIGTEPLRVSTRRAADIARSFIENRKPELAFLGGPANTGKTWLAQEVAALLAEKGWQVVVLSMLPGEKPTAEDVYHAVVKDLAFEPKTKHRRLVIIDGIEWNEELADLGEELRAISNSRQTDVLAVIRSDSSTEWPAGDPTNHVPIVRDALDELLEEVYRAYPKLADARRVESLIRRDARGDLMWLLRAIVHAAEHPEVANETQLGEQIVALRLPTLAPGEQRTIAKIAALSSFGVFAPDWMTANLTELSRAALRSLGGIATDKGWLIPSRPTCDALLRAKVHAVQRDARSSTTPLSEVERCLAEGLAKSDGVFVLAILERVDPQNERSILEQLIRLQRRPLNDWATGVIEPAMLARALFACAPHLPVEDLSRWVERLVVSLIAYMDGLGQGELLLCLRVLRCERAFFKSESDWKDLLRKLKNGGLSAVLRQDARAAVRGRLLNALSGFRDDEVQQTLLALADRFLPKGPPYSAEDYVLALRLLGLARAAAHANDGDPASDDANRIRGACAELAEWTVPEASPGADLLLARLALRMELGRTGGLLLEDSNWEIVLEAHRKQLQQAIRSSTVAQLRVGLATIADVSRPFAVRLLDRCGFATQFKSRAASDPPGETATLLGTIGNVHLVTAFKILYETGDKPNRSLAFEIKKQIELHADPRGAARILQATGKIDALFGRVKDGFAQLLAQLLTESFILRILRSDSRVSVLYNLTQALAEAEVPFVDRAWETVCDVAVGTIERSLKKSAPQLALLMCGSSAVGARFAERFRQHVPLDRVLVGMTRSRDVEALEYFHRLAALYPSAAERFAKSVPPDIVQGLAREDRPDVLLRALCAIANTLRRAGRLQAGPTLLAQLGRRWGLDALRKTPPGDIAQTLNLLHELDPDAARRVVETLRGEKVLFNKCRRASSQPHVAMELLVAVENAAPPNGKELLDELRNTPHAWRHSLQELAHEQNPRVQATAFLQLSRLGAEPAEEIRKNVFEKVWRQRISTLGSPAAVAGLVRMFAVWDEAWGRDAASQISIDRLQHRLRQESRRDLEGAIGLVGTLFAVGSRDHARALVETLLRVKALELRLPLASIPGLLSVVEVVAPERARDLAMRAAERIAAAAKEEFIRDDVEHWNDIAWSAYYCARHSGLVELAPGERAPDSFLVAKDPGLRVWATSWLRGGAWVGEEHAKAWDELTRRPECCAPRFRLPAAAVSAGRPAAESLLRSLEPFGLRTEPARLVALVEAAAHDKRLAEWLRPQVADLEDFLQDSHHRANCFAARALAALRSL